MYVLAFAAIAWALSAHTPSRVIAGSTALIIPPAVVVLVVLRRRREWFGCQRLFWDAIAIGAMLWVIGYLGRLADTWLHAGAMSWHTVFTLSGSVAPVIALMARPHRGVRNSSTGSVAIVLASYGLLAAFIYAYFVLVPALMPGYSHRTEALITLGQVTRALLIAGAAASAWVAWHTPWRRTYVTLAAAAITGLLIRAATTEVSNAVTAVTAAGTAAGMAAGLAWLVPFLMYLWAAIDAPASPREREVVEAPGCPAHVCAVPAFLIPLIGYGVPFVHSLGATGDSMRALLTALATVGGIVLLTLRLSAQGGALARADGRARLLAAAVEQTGEAIVITRADGTIEHANEAFLRGVGYEQQDLSSLTSARLAGPGSESAGSAILRDVQEHGIWRGMLARRRNDGSVFHASCTVVPLCDAEGRLTHLVGVERDLTEELQRRDQLIHAERLSAMGSLVAGIAHEINNPLQSILGSAEVLLEDQRVPGGRRELELVRNEASRAAQIVRNLLAFTRRSRSARIRADLNDIVRSTVELRQYHLDRSGIRLTASYNDRPLRVLVNREEIQQIVLNLILNAEHAIESASGRAIRIRTFLLDGSCCVDVCDDGPGISKEIRRKIFEPFFTTKEVGQGTGLGLSISHGIAMSHGGSLELCEEPQIGACFRLKLPAEAEPATALELPRELPMSRVALVVDDEMPIRRLLGRLLRRRGFDVVEADSADAALPLVRERQPRLIVCDIRMPGRTGVDLYTQIAATLPDLHHRFVFMSGDTGQALAEELAGDVPILRKPFTAADLDAVLQKTQRH
jgi:PAS domain S-box-containing protein